MDILNNELKIDISVVVPTFNASQFLDENINSLLSQKMKNIEIIYVDDESNDNSVEIIKKYMLTDNRIKLLKQKKGGVSLARNKGLENSKGEYVIFLDADDFFESNMLSDAYKKAKRNNADIVTFGYYYYDNITKKDKKARLSGKKGLHSRDDYGKFIFKSIEIVTWNKLFKKSLLIDNKILFPVLENAEDEFFNRAACLLSERIYCIKRRYVHYRRNNSASLIGNLTYNSSGLLCGFYSIRQLKEFMIKNNLFNGDFELAYYGLANEVIEYRLNKSFRDFDSVEIAYDYLKDNLIPQIYDSYSDMEKYVLPSLVFNSKNINDFLCSYLRIIINSTVKKTRIEYKIGKFITRRIMGILQYLK